MLNLYNYEENFVRISPVTDIRDDHIRTQALKKYQLAVNKGHLRGAFDEMVWTLHAEAKSSVRINFGREQERIREGLTEEEYREFILDLKTFFLLMFGTRTQKTLSHIIRCILTERAESGFVADTKPVSKKWKSSPIIQLIVFCIVTPWATQEYIDECEKVYNALTADETEKRWEKHHPCVMNEFVSYFEFDAIMKKVWNREMTPQEKMYFFPLVLYWKVTTVLPMRVMEFCLTPYDCLTEKGGKYYLTIRRSRLKGNPDEDLRIVTYTLDKDYALCRYEIPKSLYGLIEEWRQKTKDYRHPYGLLFSTDYMSSLKYRKRYSRTDDRCFEVKHLNTLLGEFYEDYVVGYAGKLIVTEQDLMDRYFNKEDGSYMMFPGEIMKLHLRDTRHLAMINLIRWGCNPMIIRAFAGHTSSTMDEHYYGNVSKMIRCHIKLLFEKAQQIADSVPEGDEIPEWNKSQVFIDRSKPHIKVDLGDCYSEKAVNKDWSDCYAVNGNCKICRYLDRAEKEIVPTEEARKIDNETLYIIKMLKSKDIEKRIEELQRDILHLQTDMTAFTTRLIREFKAEYGEEGVL